MKYSKILAVSLCILLGACHTTSNAPKQCSEHAAKSCAHECACEKCGCDH